MKETKSLEAKEMASFVKKNPTCTIEDIGRKVTQIRATRAYNEADASLGNRRKVRTVNIKVQHGYYDEKSITGFPCDVKARVEFTKISEYGQAIQKMWHVEEAKNGKITAYIID